MVYRVPSIISSPIVSFCSFILIFFSPPLYYDWYPKLFFRVLDHRTRFICSLSVLSLIAVFSLAIVNRSSSLSVVLHSFSAAIYFMFVFQFWLGLVVNH